MEPEAGPAILGRVERELPRLLEVFLESSFARRTPCEIEKLDLAEIDVAVRVPGEVTVAHEKVGGSCESRLPTRAFCDTQAVRELQIRGPELNTERRGFDVISVGRSAE